MRSAALAFILLMTPVSALVTPLTAEDREAVLGTNLSHSARTLGFFVDTPQKFSFKIDIKKLGRPIVTTTSITDI